MAAAKVAKTEKKKITQSIDKGQVHIKSSFNNTMVTFTDMAGNVLSWSSSGKLGFKGSKKSTPFAAQSSVEDAAKVANEAGVKKLLVTHCRAQFRDNAIRVAAEYSKMPAEWAVAGNIYEL